jgi:hypothetical protein
MKILDINARELQACVQFVHRGFTISLTTISRVPELRIFDGWTDVTLELTADASSRYPTPETIALAAKSIDAYLDKN